MKENLKEYDDYNKVFTYNHLYESAEKCLLGVGWKASSQRYRNDMITNVYETYIELKENRYHSKGFYEFDIYERGKPRHIKSVHISERVVQRCLCDYALLPMMSRSLIYDNSACLKGKGIDFAINRLSVHLKKFHKEHGTEGYILKFDFSKYFDNINHDILKGIIKKYFHDKRLTNIIFEFIDNCGDRGLGLGSQISQICALAYPNEIDHYMKEKMHIKYYGRYMDDGYMIHESKEYLKQCLNELKRLCDKLDITLNEKKTQIVKLSKGITYLKKRFIILPSGKVIKTINNETTTRMRRKLKSFKKKYEEGTMAIEDIQTSMTSWLGHLKHYDAHNTARQMTTLFKELFPKEDIKSGRSSKTPK